MAILDAAVSLAIEEGLEALTLRAVARRAYVSHALVRHHFGNREQLVAATVEAAAGRTLYLEMSTEVPLAQRIDRTLGELRLQYAAMLDGGHAAAVDDVYRRYRHEVTGWLTAGGADSDDGLVQLVVAALDGLAFQRLARGPAADVDAAFAALQNLIRSARLGAGSGAGAGFGAGA